MWEGGHPKKRHRAPITVPNPNLTPLNPDAAKELRFNNHNGHRYSKSWDFPKIAT